MENNSLPSIPLGKFKQHDYLNFNNNLIQLKKLEGIIPGLFTFDRIKYLLEAEHRVDFLINDPTILSGRVIVCVNKDSFNGNVSINVQLNNVLYPEEKI